MAKKTFKRVSKFAKFPSVKGDLWLDKKYDLGSDLSQADLEKLYNAGLTNIVYKIEG